MTIADQLKKIADGLGDFCKASKATVKIAHDVPHLFKLLGDSAGSPRLAILFAGERIRNEDHADICGRVDRKFWIAISRGYSLENYPGKSLVEGVAGGLPMFELVEGGRDALRALTIGTEDEPLPFYRGTELMAFEGVTTDVYRIEIDAAADIGDLSESEPEPD